MDKNYQTLEQKQIEVLKQKQEQHRQQLKENRDKVKKRKERTRRLIVRGALAEKLIPGAEEMTNDEFQKKLYESISQPDSSVTGKNGIRQQPSAERTHHSENDV